VTSTVRLDAGGAAAAKANDTTTVQHDSKNTIGTHKRTTTMVTKKMWRQQTEGLTPPHIHSYEMCNDVRVPSTQPVEIQQPKRTRTFKHLKEIVVVVPT
jgi:hypothetical protein